MSEGAEGQVAPETRGERGSRSERSERGEGRRERGDGRRERGGERRADGPREEGAPADESTGALAGNGVATESTGMLESDGSAPREPRAQGENGDGRRRSRDRYGRDRRERGERPGRDEGMAPEGLIDDQDASAAPAPTADAGEDAPRRPRYPTGFVSDSDTPANDTAAALGTVAETVARAPVAAPVAAPTSASTTQRAGLPRVQGFTLPLIQLQEIAEGSGLQWVNSDAEKIAAVQAAIAAEPKPVHVPRERPAPVLIDEGPLVLVETRRDLSQVKLPFETPSAS